MITFNTLKKNEKVYKKFNNTPFKIKVNFSFQYYIILFYFIFINNLIFYITSLFILFYFY